MSSANARAASSGSGTSVLFPALLIFAGFLVYSNSFQGVFLLDDYHVILENSKIRSLWPPQYLIGTRPFLYFTFAVNYAFHGLNLWGYHAVNVAIHLLAALVLFGLVRRTLECRGTACRAPTSLAFAISLLWVVHPLNTQSVTYITQRAESMAGLFYLLTLCAVSRCADSRRWKIAAVLSCALGMLTKETAATVPAAAFLYDRIFISSSWREVFQKRWKFYLSLALTWSFLFLTLMRLSSSSVPKSAGLGLEHVTPLAYAMTQPGVIVHYLKLAVWPHPLCFDYAWPLAANFKAEVFPVIIIAGLVVLTLAGLWRMRPIAFLGAAFFVILAPTSSFFPILDRAAEHRMYLSLASVVALIVLTADHLLRRINFLKRLKSPLGFGMLILAALLLGKTAHSRNSFYASAEQIWRNTLGISPHNPRAESNLGMALEDAERLEEAAGHYRAALRLKPDYAKAHNNLGSALDKLGGLEEAIEHYREAVRLEPAFAKARSNLGAGLADQGRLEEAVEHHLTALRLNPNSAEALNNYGYALTKQGKLDEAIRQYEKALSLEPRFAEARNNLGVALAMKGNLSEAIRQFSEALKIAPDYEDARQNLLRAQYAQKGT